MQQMATMVVGPRPAEDAGQQSGSKDDQRPSALGLKQQRISNNTISLSSASALTSTNSIAFTADDRWSRSFLNQQRLSFRSSASRASGSRLLTRLAGSEDDRSSSLPALAATAVPGSSSDEVTIFRGLHVRMGLATGWYHLVLLP